MRSASVIASLRWFALAFALVAADQATKMWAQAALPTYGAVEITPFFNLVQVHNTGAAFSFLAGAGGWQRWFFVVVTVVISVAIAIWLVRIAPRRGWTPLPLALILGGAIGNLIDRLRFGHVIDFLDFHAAGWHWPAFNVADAAISCGAVLLIWLSLTGRE